MSDDDPTAWLGDPVQTHLTNAGNVYINVPPGERERVLVLSLVDAPTIDDTTATATTFVRVNLVGARGLRDGLDRAISQLEEHAE